MNVTDQDPAAQRLHPISAHDFVRPLNDRVFVFRLMDWPNDTSRVLMPECAEKPSRRGVVVAVGPGKRDEYGKRQALAVKRGDIIYFGRYTDYDDGRYVFIQEADIVGVVDYGEKREGQEGEKRQKDQEVDRQG